jgi:uncharacterized membrane protein
MLEIFSEVSFTNQWPLPWMAAVLSGVLVCLIWLFSRLAVPVSRPIRLFLFLLRLTAVVIVFLILLDPYWKRSGEQPYLGVVVDTSRSMAVQDYEEGLSRIDSVKQYFKKDTYWDEVVKKYRPLFFTFDGLLREETDPLGWQAKGNSSRLELALSGLNRRFGSDRDFLGLVVFTDGNATDFHATDFRMHHDTVLPWIAVGVGQEGPVANVAMLAPDTKDWVFTGEIFPLTARWESNLQKPFPGILNVAVDGKPYRRLEIDLRSGSVDVDLSFIQDGNHVVDLELEPFPGEYARVDNSARVWVRSEPRVVRVYYAEAFYKDVNYFKQALEEDRDFKVSFSSSLIGFSREKSVPFIKDPFYGLPVSREEMLQYDAIILSDVKRSLLSRDQVEWIRELVEEKGGALVMIGGMDSFGDGGYVGSEIEKMLPVEISEEYKKDHYLAARGTNEHPFRPVINEDARHHYLMRLAEDDEVNRRIWETMPLLGGYNYVGRLKPGATVLLEHPADISQFGPRIMAAVQPYGKGRVLAFTSDVTPNWGVDFQEWRDESEGWLYARFWQRALKWLTENRLREKIAPLSVMFEPSLLEDSHPMRVIVRLPENGGTFFSRTLQLEILNGNQSVQNQTWDGAALSGQVEWDIRSVPAGDYYLAIRYGRTGQEPWASKVPFSVHVSRAESRHLDARPDLLESYAAVTKGFFLPMSQMNRLDQMLHKLQNAHWRRSSEPFWNRPSIYAFLLFLLFLDWFVRKRKGLE